MKRLPLAPPPTSYSGVVSYWPLRIRLADYHAQLVRRSDWEWFFPGRARLPLTLGNIDKNFRRFLWQARISHGGRGRGPRVHDLRH